MKAALAAGGLGAAMREQIGELDRQLMIDELALLAEFEDDGGAMERLMIAITYDHPLEHEAERIRQDRAEAADHQRIHAELEATGRLVTNEMVPGSSLLSSLAHDGEDLTEDNHRDCPGMGRSSAPTICAPGVLLRRSHRQWPCLAGPSPLRPRPHRCLRRRNPRLEAKVISRQSPPP